MKTIRIRKWRQFFELKSFCDTSYTICVLMSICEREWQRFKAVAFAWSTDESSFTIKINSQTMSSLYKQSNLLEKSLDLPERVLFILAASKYSVSINTKTKRIQHFTDWMENFICRKFDINWTSIKSVPCWSHVDWPNIRRSWIVEILRFGIRTKWKLFHRLGRLDIHFQS